MNNYAKKRNLVKATKDAKEADDLKPNKLRKIGKIYSRISTCR